MTLISMTHNTLLQSKMAFCTMTLGIMILGRMTLGYTQENKAHQNGIHSHIMTLTE